MALIGVVCFLAVVSWFVNVWDLSYTDAIGGSNKPTVRDGQKILYMKPWRELRVGDLVLAKWPGGLMMKRIDKIRSGDGKLWLQGDNREPGESLDSGCFGWFDRPAISYLLVARLPKCFDGPPAAVVEGRPKKGASPYKPLAPSVITSDYMLVAQQLEGRKTKEYAFSIPDIFMGKVKTSTCDVRLPLGTKYVSVCWVGEGVADARFNKSKLMMAPTRDPLAQFCTIPGGVDSIRFAHYGGNPVRIRLIYYR